MHLTAAMRNITNTLSNIAPYAPSPGPKAHLLYDLSVQLVSYMLAHVSTPTVSLIQLLNSGTSCLPFEDRNTGVYQIACYKEPVRGHESWRASAIININPGIAWITLWKQEYHG